MKNPEKVNVLLFVEPTLKKSLLYAEHFENNRKIVRNHSLVNKLM